MLSEVGITVENETQNEETFIAADLILRSSSIRSLYDLIMTCKLSLKFVRKYTQLCLISLIVTAIIQGVGLVLFNHCFFRAIQVLWTTLILLPLLSFVLLSSKGEEDAADQNKEEGKIKLITDEAWKEIFILSLAQTVFIGVFLVFGGQVIPEQSDSVDELIQGDWRAKYAHADRTFMANGLEYSVTGDELYAQTLNQYDVFSRHYTFVFTLYSLLQIFNSLVCRKLGDKDINIFTGLSAPNLLALVATIGLQILFTQCGGQNFALYP